MRCWENDWIQYAIVSIEQKQQKVLSTLDVWPCEVQNKEMLVKCDVGQWFIPLFRFVWSNLYTASSFASSCASMDNKKNTLTTRTKPGGVYQSVQGGALLWEEVNRPELAQPWIDGLEGIQKQTYPWDYYVTWDKGPYEKSSILELAQRVSASFILGDFENGAGAARSDLTAGLENSC